MGPVTEGREATQHGGAELGDEHVGAEKHAGGSEEVRQALFRHVASASEIEDAGPANPGPTGAAGPPRRKETPLYVPIPETAFRWAPPFIGALKKVGVRARAGVRLYKGMGAPFFQETLGQRGAGYSIVPLLLIGSVGRVLGVAPLWLSAGALTLLAVSRARFVLAHTTGQRLAPLFISGVVLATQGALLWAAPLSWERLAEAYTAAILLTGVISSLLDAGASRRQKEVELSQFATLLRSRGQLALAAELAPAFRGGTHRRTSPLKDRVRIFSSDAEVVNFWKDSWEERLSASRPSWGVDPRYAFPYGADAPSIAYDPRAIPERPLGPFVQALYEPPPESNAKVQSRRQIRNSESLDPEATLLNELPNEMMADPGRPDELAVVPNRWPRRPYHSLVMSRLPRAQRLTPGLIWSEMEWASRGVVVEFHRRGLLLNHFHFHIIPAEHAPIARHASGFKPSMERHRVQFGALKDYPVPHLAISSARQSVLNRAVYLLYNQFESENLWYNLAVIQRPSDRQLIFVFFLWPERWIRGFSFNEFGLIRSENTGLTEEAAVKAIREAHTSGRELEAIGERFQDFWTRRAVLDPLGIVPAILSVLRQVDRGWAYARPAMLSARDLRRVFELYRVSYAGPAHWRKFECPPGDHRRLESVLEEFRAGYDHAFIHRDPQEDIEAFILTVDSGFGVRCNLGGADIGSRSLLVRSFIRLKDVEGFYAFVSGSFMEMLLERMSAGGDPGAEAPPIVDPRAALTHFDMDDARPDLDGVRYYRWRPEGGRRVRKHGMILGRPVIPGPGGEARFARVGATFCVNRELESVLRDGVASEEQLRALLARLDRVAISDRDGLEAALEAWRGRTLRLPIVLAIARITGKDAGLWDSYVTLRTFEEALPREVLEDMLGGELRRMSDAWKADLLKHARLLLTEEFRNTHAILGRGKEAVMNVLLDRVGGGFRTIVVSGAPGVGKSTFAAALKAAMEERGRNAVIVPTDAFLRLRQRPEALATALLQQRAEAALWDMDGYREFLQQVDAFRRGGMRSGVIVVPRYYDVQTKTRCERRIPLGFEDVLVVEGWGALDASTKRHFDDSLFLDVRDDEVVKQSLLKRNSAARDSGGAEVERRAAYLEIRFADFDRPLAASFRLAGHTTLFDNILDNSDVREPVVYAGRCR